MKRYSLVGILAALAFIAAGCGTDGPTGPQPDLPGDNEPGPNPNLPAATNPTAIQLDGLTLHVA